MSNILLNENTIIIDICIKEAKEADQLKSYIPKIEKKKK